MYECEAVEDLRDYSWLSLSRFPSKSHVRVVDSGVATLSYVNSPYHTSATVTMPPRKGKAKAKKAESPEPLSIPGSSSYPGKNAERKGMDAPQWDACRKMLEGVYNTREDE